MIDRAIEIVGIALAVLFGLAPFTDFKLPIWATYVGIGLGIWLIGVAVGLFAGAQRKPSKATEPQIIETNLFLQFSDGHSVPVEKNPRNIQSWYALYTESIYVNAKDIGGRMVGGFSVTSSQAWPPNPRGGRPTNKKSKYEYQRISSAAVAMLHVSKI